MSFQRHFTQKSCCRFTVRNNEAMKRTINNNAIRLETEVTLNGYTVKGRKRSKAVYQAQSSRTAKSNKIQRNMAKLDNLETKLMQIAFKAKRSELQRNERMAKREARMK